MATPKQTKTAPAASEASAAKAPQSPRSSRGANDKFIRVFGDDGKPTPLPKVPPQVKVIVDGVEKAGKKGITRGELVTSITGTLITRQPPERIVSYYEKKMQELGLVKIEKQATPVPAAVAA